jgi:hypothetical protein
MKKLRARLMSITAVYPLVLTLVGMVLPNPMGVAAISRNEQDEIITKICSLLESNYVLPEIGERVSTHLLASHERGEYSELSAVREFAARLDADLTEWSNDKHLGIVYDPDWVKQIKEQKEEDAYLTEEMVAEERARNFGFKRMEILDGNVGYLDLRIFFHPKYAGATAVAGMNFLSACDAVIIDLKNNGGGWGHMVAFLCSYFLDNEEVVHLNSVYSRPEDRHYQSWTSPYVPGRIMADIPLYILTSKSTFSAAEEFCYNLKYLERATIVGERTRGGAHPISSVVLDDNLILILPEWTSIHPVTNTNWEGVGVEPDFEVAAVDAFNVAYLNALEKLRGSAQGEEKRVSYQWYIDGFKARLSPFAVDAAVLESYVGKYGSLSIHLEDAMLFYQRGDRALLRMIPMSETLFLVDEQSDVRIRFKKQKGRISGLTAMYIDGNKTEYVREDG